MGEVNNIEPKVLLNKKYLPLYTSSTRYHIVTGGRGNAKSFHVADFLLKLTYEPNHIILFTRYVMKSADDSIIAEFIDKIDRYDLEDVFDVKQAEIVNRLTGSKILFKGIKTSSGVQTASLKSLQGITTFVIDEAEELVDEDIFDKIDFSVRQVGVDNRVIMVMNPALRSHWI